ncbi:MAG: hydroxymethylglutaryl-CoA lyase [Candidatus Lambdaproteobacteria bacterium]|nr:hydroxymethylglutaryl-CoA lyase [Candidatus Lambdaproteobacteria bacterium]
MFENLPEKVTIREVGPRDGLQNESQFIATPVKKEFIRRLVAAGLPHIEITSFVNPKWIPGLADCAEIGKEFAQVPGTVTSALVPNAKGLEGAKAAGLKEVSVFMSASESHNKANINKSIAETLRIFEELIPQIRQAGLAVEGMVSVVCGCPYEGAVEPRKVVEIAKTLLRYGATAIGLGDTVGVGTPLQVKRLLDMVIPEVGKDRIRLHLHDTQGTAVANAVAALELGVTHFDSSVGGLGGCPYAPGASGNVPTENLVYTLHGMGVKTGIDLHALLETGAWIQDQLGHPLPSNGLKAYLGRKVRAEQKATAAAS